MLPVSRATERARRDKKTAREKEDKGRSGGGIRKRLRGGARRDRDSESEKASKRASESQREVGRDVLSK